jgi:hypothetical protein
MVSFDIDYHSEDTESLARVTTLTLNNKKAILPNHATTAHDVTLFQGYSKKEFGNHNINLAYEHLAYDTLYNIGKSIEARTDLQKRFSAKLLEPSNTINFVYPRIPKQVLINKIPVAINTITDLQISGIVGAELDAGADIVIPPIPSNISQRNIFEKVIDRTINEIQTFNSKKPLMAYIPNTNDPLLAANMIELYLKKDKECRMFGIDFAGASYPQALLRAVIGSIRRNLKIKPNSEKNEKYYLHGFNVAINRKSKKPITQVTDPLVHTYGIDSTSSVIWGGGKVDPEKCRYVVIDDYGAYQKKKIMEHGTTCQCPVCKKFPLDEIYGDYKVLERLKVHRIAVLKEEFNLLNSKISESDSTKGYIPHFRTKPFAVNDIEKILKDVKEIKAIR